jgi:hypothetical protein
LFSIASVVAIAYKFRDPRRLAMEHEAARGAAPAACGSIMTWLQDG